MFAGPILHSQTTTARLIGSLPKGFRDIAAKFNFADGNVSIKTQGALSHNTSCNLKITSETGTHELKFKLRDLFSGNWDKALGMLQRAEAKGELSQFLTSALEIKLAGDQKNTKQTKLFDANGNLTGTLAEIAKIAEVSRKKDFKRVLARSLHVNVEKVKAKKSLYVSAKAKFLQLVNSKEIAKLSKKITSGFKELSNAISKKIDKIAEEGIRGLIGPKLAYAVNMSLFSAFTLSALAPSKSYAGETSGGGGRPDAVQTYKYTFSGQQAVNYAYNILKAGKNYEQADRIIRTMTGGELGLSDLEKNRGTHTIAINPNSAEFRQFDVYLSKHKDYVGLDVQRALPAAAAVAHPITGNQIINAYSNAATELVELFGKQASKKIGANSNDHYDLMGALAEKTGLTEKKLWNVAEADRSIVYDADQIQVNKVQEYVDSLLVASRPQQQANPRESNSQTAPKETKPKTQAAPVVESKTGKEVYSLYRNAAELIKESLGVNAAAFLKIKSSDQASIEQELFRRYPVVAKNPLTNESLGLHNLNLNGTHSGSAFAVKTFKLSDIQRDLSRIAVKAQEKAMQLQRDAKPKQQQDSAPIVTDGVKGSDIYRMYTATAESIIRKLGNNAGSFLGIKSNDPDAIARALYNASPVVAQTPISFDDLNRKSGYKNSLFSQKGYRLDQNVRKLQEIDTKATQQAKVNNDYYRQLQEKQERERRLQQQPPRDGKYLIKPNGKKENNFERAARESQGAGAEFYNERETKKGGGEASPRKGKKQELPEGQYTVRSTTSPGRVSRTTNSVILNPDGKAVADVQNKTWNLGLFRVHAPFSERITPKNGVTHKQAKQAYEDAEEAARLALKEAKKAREAESSKTKRNNTFAWVGKR